MIRLATSADIPRILEITKACAKHMITKEIYQWNEHYPSEKVFINDVSRKDLYVKVLDNSVIGGIVISTFMDKEYESVKWLSFNKCNIYIHRLAIHPNQQGKSYAQELMSYAENFAKIKRFTSVRLDPFSNNKRNQRFYEKRGYQKLDDIYFPKQSEYPFHCYELVL